MSDEQKAPGVFHRIGGASNIPPKDSTPVSKDEIPEHFRFSATLTDHPIVRDADGTLRYQQNPLIRWLCDEIDLNRMWVEYRRHHTWTQEQFMQFYRDIGYSLSGFEEIWGEALDEMEGIESEDDDEEEEEETPDA